MTRKTPSISIWHFVILGITTLFCFQFIVQTNPIFIKEMSFNWSTNSSYFKPELRIPTKEDLHELESSYNVVSSILGSTDLLKSEILELYQEVQDALVCSETNDRFNVLDEKYKEYVEKATEAQALILDYEKKYNEYLDMLATIPEFSKALRDEKYAEFEEFQSTYAEIDAERQEYEEDKETLLAIYTDAQKIADDYFWLVYDLACHIAFAEAGNCPPIEQCYVLNVIENRQKSPAFIPTTFHDVVWWPGQYSPTWNGGIYKTPSEETKYIVQEYLRGRVDTGMPDNVVWQAQFPQGKGIWKIMPSGHYFCYS